MPADLGFDNFFRRRGHLFNDTNLEGTFEERIKQLLERPIKN